MPLKCIVLVLFISLISCLQSFGQNTQTPQNNWQLSQQYTPPDVRSSNLFASEVDIDGNYAIASAHRHSPIINGDTIKRAGAAYLFEKDANGQWNEVQKLTAPDAVDYDYFGVDVGISGTTAVVGASHNSSDANNQSQKLAAGAVYIFERDDNGIWQFWQKLTASDRDTLDRFGGNIHIHHNQLMISAPIKDDEELAVGCVYYFTKNEAGYWIEQQKIIPPDNKAYIRFGSTLHFDDNVLVVGAPHESGVFLTSDGLYETFKFEHGSAYIYEMKENGLWQFSKRLILGLRQLSQTNFGRSVAVTTLNNKSYVFVGHPRWETFDRENYPNQSQYTGGVHLYAKTDKNDWVLQETLIPAADSFAQLAFFGSFGKSISIDANNLVISYWTRLNDFPGAIDVFSFDGNKWGKISDIEIPQIKSYNRINIVINNNNILAGIISDNNSIFTFNNEVLPSVAAIPQIQHSISYPNPFTSTLYFNKNQNIPLKKIKITSVSGQLLYYSAFKTIPDKIQFNYPNGIYLLTATDIHNKVFTQKIIKY